MTKKQYIDQYINELEQIEILIHRQIASELQKKTKNDFKYGPWASQLFMDSATKVHQLLVSKTNEIEKREKKKKVRKKK